MIEIQEIPNPILIQVWFMQIIGIWEMCNSSAQWRLLKPRRKVEQEILITSENWKLNFNFAVVWVALLN